MTEGEAEEETWPSVNLFFVSSLIYRRNQQIREGVVCSIDLKAEQGPHESLGAPGLRLVTEERGPLQRAPSCCSLTPQLLVESGIFDVYLPVCLVAKEVCVP